MVRGEVSSAQRRGQLTLIVAVGLVLLFVIAILYIMLLRRNPSTGNIRDAANNPALNAYVASCADNAMITGLKRLGEQGGVLDNSSYKNLPFAKVTLGTKQITMLYGITRNRDCPQPPPPLDGTEFCIGNKPGVNILKIKPFSYNPPHYPDWGVGLDKLTINPEVPPPDGPVEFLPFQDGFFGDVNFPAVCDSGSVVNGINGEEKCRYYANNPPGTPGPSAQVLLTTMLKTRLQSCVDLANFSDAIGQEVVKVDAPEVNVTFTSTSVIANINYPLLLKSGTSTVTLPFSRRYDVRYRDIAEFAIDISRANTRDPHFVMNNKSSYEALHSYKDGFVVDIGRDHPVTAKTPTTGVYGGASALSLDNKADLVTITDGKSNLEGHSYTFAFLIEHRPPMLDNVTYADASVVHADCTLGAAMIAISPDNAALSCAYDTVAKELIVTDNKHTMLKDCIFYNNDGTINTVKTPC